jgi:hypothetical protein
VEDLSLLLPESMLKTFMNADFDGGSLCCLWLFIFAIWFDLRLKVLDEYQVHTCHE